MMNGRIASYFFPSKKGDSNTSNDCINTFDDRMNVDDDESSQIREKMAATAEDSQNYSSSNWRKPFPSIDGSPKNDQPAENVSTFVGYTSISTKNERLTDGSIDSAIEVILHSKRANMKQRSGVWGMCSLEQYHPRIVPKSIKQLKLIRK
jgi:hypothetical protein